MKNKGGIIITYNMLSMFVLIYWKKKGQEEEMT